MRTQIFGKFLTILLLVASIGAMLSCAPKKTSVKMKSIGDPKAAENRAPPMVVMVSAADADGKYVTGDTLTITVQFSKVVLVEGDGNITLALATGASSHNALYISGTESDTLAFSYVIVDGDRSDDLQYSSPQALTLGANTVLKDEFNHDADLTLPSLDSDASLAGQKNLMINAPTAIVDKTAAEDLGIHFEKSYYQTRSTKRLLVRNDLVSGLEQTNVKINQQSFACNVTPSFTSPFVQPSSALASLEFNAMSAMDSGTLQTTYGSAQSITIELDHDNVADNQTIDKITVKDFELFDMASSGFSGDVQMSDGFQGWISPIAGMVSTSDSTLISGFHDMVNR